MNTCQYIFTPVGKFTGAPLRMCPSPALWKRTHDGHIRYYCETHRGMVLSVLPTATWVNLTGEKFSEMRRTVEDAA